MIKDELHIDAEYLQFKSLAIVLGLLPSVRQLLVNALGTDKWEQCERRIV